MLNVFCDYYYCYIHFFLPFFKSVNTVIKWHLEISADVFVDEADSDVFMFGKIWISGWSIIQITSVVKTRKQF